MTSKFSAAADGGDSDFDEPAPYLHLRTGGGRQTSPSKSSSQFGGKQSRAVDTWHVFPDNHDFKDSCASQFFWLYGAFEFKNSIPMEAAKQHVFRLIDKLVTNMKGKVAAPSTAEKLDQQQQQHSSSNPIVGTTGSSSAVPQPPVKRMVATANNPSIPASINQSLLSQLPNSNSPPRAKGHLIFDIISTKKHITAGLPHQLGTEIYKYIDSAHPHSVVTTFVGLTDNTARRVGRDAYYHFTNDLSKTQIEMSSVDFEHLFIIYPPMPEHHSASGKDSGKPSGALPGKKPAASSSGGPLPSPRGGVNNGTGGFSKLLGQSAQQQGGRLPSPRGIGTAPSGAMRGQSPRGLTPRDSRR